MLKWLSICIASLAILFAFQNCSSKTFSAKSDSNTPLSVDDTNNTTGDGGGTPTEVDEDIDTTPTNQVDFSSCMSFQELTGDTISVPARTGAGECYYIRLMSARSVDSSGARGEPLAMDVNARMHATTNNDSHPYVLAQKDITMLQLQGARNVALSSDFRSPQASMFIDNFFLIEQSTEVGTYRAWAYGTADSVPINGKISVNGQEVQDFYSYAPKGTATVTAINMTAAIPAGLKMSIRFRGLDCGVSAQASDVFMVFH
jgi:hypothetical protein